MGFVYCPSVHVLEARLYLLGLHLLVQGTRMKEELMSQCRLVVDEMGEWREGQGRMLQSREGL